MMTVSAATRLMPTPPARVDRRKIKAAEPPRLNRSMAACRASMWVLPSSRSKAKRRSLRKSASRSSIIVNWLKMSTQCASARNLGSSLSSSTSLPDADRKVSRRVAALIPVVLASSTPLMRKGWLQVLRSSICRLFRVETAAPATPPTRRSRLVGVRVRVRVES
eukprot:scaffold107768_cov57-Phaeocystis_antarctica.AAC.2